MDVLLELLFSTTARVIGFISTRVAAAFTYFIRLLIVAVQCAAIYLLDHSTWLLRWDIILSMLATIIESASAVLEQNYPNKLTIAGWGVVIAVVSLILGLADIAYRRNEYQRRARSNNKPDRYHRSLEWNFEETFGLVFSILTLMSASLHYHYLDSGKPQPIRFSMVPLAFSICVMCSRIFRRTTINKLDFVMKCDHLGEMKLDIESGGELYNKDGPTRFACLLCAMRLPHPLGLTFSPTIGL